MDQDTRHFRAGVGTVIYNEDNQVVWFKRAYNPIGVWQFQQGGIDCGETPETTLWRELLEETGLAKEDFTAIDEYPHWTVHAYPQQQNEDGTLIKRIGQVHRWFFLKLKSDTTIDLTHATTDEFSEAMWVEFSEAVAGTVESKTHVYKALQEYFDTNIK